MPFIAMAATVRTAQKAIVNRETVRVNVPLPALWELLSNTQRVNQTLGLPPAVFSPVPGESRMDAHASFMGVRFNWAERPFEWVERRWYRVQRDFQGLLTRVLVSVSFEPLTAQSTEVTIRIETNPANPLGHLMARTVLGRRTLQQYRALIQQWEQQYRHQQTLTFPPTNTPFVNDAALEQLEKTLRRDTVASLPAALVDRLVTHLRTASDDEVVRMRPLALADAWGFDRLDTVRLFLHATRKGLTDLHWEVLCPNCRVSKASYERLSDLNATAHCDTCQIDFDAEFDRYVELRFSSHPGIRHATAYTYCVGGPFNARHVVAQQRIPGNGQVSFTFAGDPGEYRVRCGGKPGRARLTLAADEEKQNGILVVRDDGPEADELRCGADREVSLTVVSLSAEEQTLIVERDTWDAQILSAARVTALQEFRNLFSSEVLGVGMGVEVRTLNVMFTDLKGSTKLYIDAGDSRAYRQVRDQFAVLIEAITRHRGALVKTIGDAVMAVFYEGTDAVEAAVDMQAGIARLNESAADRFPLQLKAGIHAGPCIVITANDTLDYFGTTVNTASYCASLGAGGDIVMTESAIEQAGVRPLLEGYTVEPLSRALKGVQYQTSFYRVLPGTAPGSGGFEVTKANSESRSAEDAERIE